MSIAASPPPIMVAPSPERTLERELPAAPDTSAPVDTPGGWRELRDNADIQFEPVDFVPPPPPEPREPGWFEEMLGALFGWLGDLLAPVGRMLGISWPVLQWILLGLLIVFVLYLAWRTFGSATGRNRKAKAKSTHAASDPDWQPDREESVALLEDADRLAAEGRYDEAVHLLLQRSVSQIAEVRPDWVDPSSTARELAALPTLSNAARTAFRVIADRVEQSLFALRALNSSDWDAARKAYADFALAKIAGLPIDNQAFEGPRVFGRKAATA